MLPSFSANQLTGIAYPKTDLQNRNLVEKTLPLTQFKRAPFYVVRAGGSREEEQDDSDVHISG